MTANLLLRVSLNYGYVRAQQAGAMLPWHDDPPLCGQATYVARPQSKFPCGRLQKQNPNLMETFIGTDTVSVELFFSIFTSGIETFVIPWDQLLYPCVVEVYCLGLEPLCDTHLRLSVILKALTLTGQEFLEV